MAFVHGSDSVFKLDNAGGSLTDISTYVNNVDFPETADVAETSTLGASNKTYIVGLKDATISLGGLFDATVDAIAKAPPPLVELAPLSVTDELPVAVIVALSKTKPLKKPLSLCISTEVATTSPTGED